MRPEAVREVAAIAAGATLVGIFFLWPLIKRFQVSDLVRPFLWLLVWLGALAFGTAWGSWQLKSWPLYPWTFLSVVSWVGIGLSVQWMRRTILRRESREREDSTR
jgi:hypothetical protein